MTSSDSVRSSTLARSEEDDSDDSGVIKDVSKRHSVDDNNAITDTDAVPKPSSDISQNKSYTAGDLVWARAQNSTFFPCVVTNDPHYKFCTKIVKSDPGHHGGGTLSPNVEQRQYHVQYLVDNRRLWLNQSNIINRALFEINEETPTAKKIHEMGPTYITPWESQLIQRDYFHLRNVKK